MGIKKQVKKVTLDFDWSYDEEGTLDLQVKYHQTPEYGNTITSADEEGTEYSMPASFFVDVYEFLISQGVLKGPKVETRNFPASSVAASPQQVVTQHDQGIGLPEIKKIGGRFDQESQDREEALQSVDMANPVQALGGAAVVHRAEGRKTATIEETMDVDDWREEEASVDRTAPVEPAKIVTQQDAKTAQIQKRPVKRSVKPAGGERSVRPMGGGGGQNESSLISEEGDPMGAKNRGIGNVGEDFFKQFEE